VVVTGRQVLPAATSGNAASSSMMKQCSSLLAQPPPTTVSDMHDEKIVRLLINRPGPRSSQMKPAAVLFDLRIEGAYIHNLLHTATREVLLVTCTIL
jgi:hypothetical protein